MLQCGEGEHTNYIYSSLKTMLSMRSTVDGYTDHLGRIIGRSEWLIVKIAAGSVGDISTSLG